MSAESSADSIANSGIRAPERETVNWKAGCSEIATDNFAT